MKHIGESSLWVERYRPKYLTDYICSEANRKLFQTVIDQKEVDCFLFEGSGGTGKTTLAQIIAHELDADLLYMNGSLETSIDDIRYKVKQFSMTSSLMGGKKIIIIDELDRMSAQAQDALKVLQEQTESNARFIFCTNNLQRIIQPLQSRAQVISFGKEKTKELMVGCFKRLCFILDNEGFEYSKEILKTIMMSMFPDFRKTIGRIQILCKMYGCVNEFALAFTDNAMVSNLIGEMKTRKFNTVRKICSELDTATFYTEFYALLDEHVEDQCKPDVILALAEYAAKDSSTLDKEINVVACIISIMQVVKWR